MHRIIELEADAGEDGLKLSTEAGWNQIAADWEMMLKAGKGFGVRDGRRLVASALALPHPPLFGWVSMVLVTQSHRRRGLARALLLQAIEYLRGLGLTPMLDATPAGRSVYLPLGFLDIEAISRWRRADGPFSQQQSEERFDLDSVLRLDRLAFGGDRSAILKDLASRGAFAASSPSGAFLISRAGRTATQIGPIVAKTAEEAVALLELVLAGIAGPLLIDVPDREGSMAKVLGRQGFSVERSFTRMGLGRSAGFGEYARVRATAGPEIG